MTLCILVTCCSYYEIIATVRTPCVYRIPSLGYSYVSYTRTCSIERSQKIFDLTKILSTTMRTVYDDVNFLQMPQRLRAKWKKVVRCSYVVVGFMWPRLPRVRRNSRDGRENNRMIDSQNRYIYACRSTITVYRMRRMIIVGHPNSYDKS